MKMKKTLLCLAVVPMLVLSSCDKEGCTDSTANNYDSKADKDDGTCTYDAVVVDSSTYTITGNITSNTTWKTGKTYLLNGRIAVTAGAVLTIEPGAVVKGQAGTGANASALIIAQGAKIMAEGTSSSPIIFTSQADNIKPGSIASPNLDATTNGLWGGLIILGKAPISADAASVQIEGIPASDQNGLYGGSDAADNSGVLKYISIRHGGANIGEGNEINGLTLGGVGSGTVVEYVEVVGNQDDGIEFFGGTVNVSNVVVVNVGDDAIDTDQAWSGTLSNFAIVCGDVTDHALEIDGPEGSLLAGHTVMNGSVKGNAASELADFRSNARGTFKDIYFFGFTDPATGTVTGRGDLSLSTGSDVTFGAGDLVFSNLQCALPAGVALTAVFKNGTSAHASSVTSSTKTVGATTSSFTGWSWAATAGLLSDF